MMFNTVRFGTTTPVRFGIIPKEVPLNIGTKIHDGQGTNYQIVPQSIRQEEQGEIVGQHAYRSLNADGIPTGIVLGAGEEHLRENFSLVI